MPIRHLPHSIQALSTGSSVKVSACASFAFASPVLRSSQLYTHSNLSLLPSGEALSICPTGSVSGTDLTSPLESLCIATISQSCSGCAGLSLVYLSGISRATGVERWRWIAACNMEPLHRQLPSPGPLRLNDICARASPTHCSNTRCVTKVDRGLGLRRSMNERARMRREGKKVRHAGRRAAV
jgi:hypothetical protein